MEQKGEDKEGAKINKEVAGKVNASRVRKKTDRIKGEEGRGLHKIIGQQKGGLRIDQRNGEWIVWERWIKLHEKKKEKRVRSGSE